MPAHAACHATPQRELPKQAAPKAILAATRRRFQQRLDHEHARAANLAASAGAHGARAAFQRYWIATGVATTRQHGPRANLFSTPPPAARPEPGVHIIVAAIHLPARGKQPPAGGWAIEAHDVADDEQR